MTTEQLATYIGVKMVQAVPMDKDGEQGYKVVYPDGYESWSPREQFERAYISLEDPTKITEGDVDNFYGSRPKEVMTMGTTTTVVNATDRTGFEYTASSACVDPENYDIDFGEELALKKIQSKIWAHLGFVLSWAKYGLHK